MPCAWDIHFLCDSFLSFCADQWLSISDMGWFENVFVEYLFEVDFLPSISDENIRFRVWIGLEISTQMSMQGLTTFANVFSRLMSICLAFKDGFVSKRR